MQAVQSLLPLIQECSLCCHSHLTGCTGSTTYHTTQIIQSLLPPTSYKAVQVLLSLTSYSLHSLRCLSHHTGCTISAATHTIIGHTVCAATHTITGRTVCAALTPYRLYNLSCHSHHYRPYSLCCHSHHYRPYSLCCHSHHYRPYSLCCHSHHYRPYSLCCHSHHAGCTLSAATQRCSYTGLVQARHSLSWSRRRGRDDRELHLEYYPEVGLEQAVRSGGHLFFPHASRHSGQ